LKNFGWADDIPSPNRRRFLARNLGFLAILSFLPSIALRNHSQNSPETFGCFRQIRVLCACPFLFLHYPLHFVLICPFSYVGYLGSSAVVHSLTGSSADIELAQITSAGEQSRESASGKSLLLIRLQPKVSLLAFLLWHSYLLRKE
jgi:hypothetical protein